MKQIVLSIALILALCFTANAAEELSDWGDYTEGDIQTSVSGSTVSLSGTSPSDSYSWGSLGKYFPHANGVMATVNINSTNNEGWCGIGVRKYIGALASGNLILADIYVANHKGDTRVQYRVRERLTDGTTVRDFSRGPLGSYSNTWNTGEDISIGIGVVGSDICFYTSKTEGITKVKLDASFSPVEKDTQIAIAPEEGGSISGTVKDLTILYASDMKVFSDATSMGDGCYLANTDLGVKAVINTVDGPINAVFNKAGEKTTESGATVIYGHFYADPADVTWGDAANPDLYVKIWFDPSGRIDVNYFHVSVPDIVVYSDYPYDGSFDQTGTTTMDNRYIRHEFTKKP